MTHTEYPVKVTMPPAIMRGVDKTFIVAGCMIQVPHDITKEDIPKYVTYERPVTNAKVWKVKSPSGSTYTVKRYDDGRYNCDCQGFKFYKRCKHVKSVSK